MKKLIFLFSAFLFVGTSVFAQSPEDGYKEAKKLYTKAVSATDNEQKEKYFLEARTNMEIATADLSGFDDRTKARILVKAGDINNELGALDLVYINLTQKQEIKFPEAPIKAFDAYTKAIEVAGDNKKMKRDKSDAVNGLVNTRNYLDNAARIAYGVKKDYAVAYENFNAITDLREVVNNNIANSKKIMVADSTFNNHLYLVGLSAWMSKDMDAATETFMTLKERKYDDPLVYNVLYEMKLNKEDTEGAVAILEEGRKLYPEDETLRIAEINYYLKEGKLDELTGKLKSAIDASPDNVSLYLTLGHVYDNLFQREMEAGNTESADKNFENALDYYNQGLQKDDKNHSAIYSVGALYYNRAAMMTKELVNLEGDYSKAGLAKYDAKKKKVFAAFDEALPFFKKAEAMDPNDVGTLTALREIFAKKDDLEKYNEFKSRLEKIESGEKMESSFFNEK